MTETDMSSFTRRKYIASIVGAATATAGCSGDGSTGAETGSGSESGTVTPTAKASPFAGFEVSGATLSINLAEGELPESIAVYNPEDALYSEIDVPPGASKVTTDLSGYTPGEYRFVAVDSNGEAYAETTEVFEPDPTLEAWKSSTNVDVETEYALGSSYIEVGNSGTGPISLSNIAVEGDLIADDYGPSTYDGDVPSVTLQDHEFPITIGPDATAEIVTISRELTSLGTSEDNVTDVVTIHLYFSTGQKIVAEATAKYQDMQDYESANVTLTELEVVKDGTG